MKIIGTPYMNWSHQSSCNDCGTLVELDVSDLRGVDDQRDGNAVVWRCPTCGSETWLNASIVPRHLRGKVAKR